MLGPGAGGAAPGPEPDRPAAPLQEKRERLQELKRELARERAKAEAAAEKGRSIAQEIQGIDRQIADRTREIRALEAKLRKHTADIARLGREIKSAEATLGRTRGLLKRRLRALYKQGGLAPVRLLLTAEDGAAAGRRAKYLTAIAHEDRRLVHSYSRLVAELGQKRTTLEQAQAALAENQETLKAKRQQIVAEKEQRKSLLARVQAERRTHLATARDLERAARELQALVARLQREEAATRRAARPAPPAAGARATPAAPGNGEEALFARLRGRLPWPTVGSVAVPFGRHEHPRYGTVTFTKGIGINAREGRDIVAVHEGTVLYADWFKGYGRLVIIDHGAGYYTLYANAAELLVAVGDRVAQGQPIGRVGAAGSDGSSQVYFELRHKGKPQDPVAWLVPR